MTYDQTLDRIQALVAGIAGPNRLPRQVSPDTPLGADGYSLDSIDVLEVILGCERAFDVAFDDGGALDADALRSARHLADLVHPMLTR